jgi:hypothetical protein
MAGKDSFHVVIENPGSVTYRERRREFCFPLFERDGSWVLVGSPTRKRVFLIFIWTRVSIDFEESESEVILPRILEFLRSDGEKVQLFPIPDVAEKGFQFRGELFEDRAIAIEKLAEAGIEWLTGFSSVDLLHEEYGLEVCGIKERDDLDTVADVMRETFPHWHFSGVCRKEHGRDPGWKFRIHMFRSRCGNGKCADF